MNASRVWTDCVARIDAAMAGRGLNAMRLSVKTGIPISTVRSWLNCDSVPAADKIPAICGAVGLTADELFGMEGGGNGR